jgi:hypothetical protein
MTASFRILCSSSFIIFLPFVVTFTAVTSSRDGEKTKMMMEMVNVEAKRTVVW